MEKSVSKYEIIKREIREKITSMEYKPNQVLPSESELCEKYQVSRITVRRAVDDLVKENMLYRIKGKGCFVRENSIEGLSRIHSFTEAIIHEGKTPGREQIYFSREKAGEELAAKLELTGEDEVYRLKCLYLADGERYCVSTAVLPAEMFPKLESFNFNSCSLYDVLKTFYKLNISRVKQNIFATTGEAEIQQMLGLLHEKPLLKIQATSYCLHENQEKPFEVYESYILTDILSYTIEKYNV
ncbi:GntR family transcriptional regulator [bacterium C-53]|nr:GntR family transcriptional regulator [Lachnospiraceae bacterium]NBI04009.1 GntR family transcriptional regulator [Lachnospiraceae bacterium]RKJ08793.1 GntR family transcriptional regulator [bacterium C-53]